jgi:hypothetical protein
MDDRVGLPLSLFAVMTMLGTACAPVQSSVSASAPHLPMRVLAKAAPPSNANSQPLCPAASRYPSPTFPRDSVEASWRWPKIMWHLSCPGTSAITVVSRH